MDKSNPVVVITGCSSGFGEGAAKAFADKGYRVWGTLRDATGRNANKKTALEAYSSRITVVDMDVTDDASVAAAFAHIHAQGPVDVLINNAGILRDKTFAKMSLEDFRSVIDVHLFGSVNCTKAVWDIMREQQYGRIVMTTSSSGLYGNFGQSNYGAAKMALVGLMNTLVLEGNKFGIRVNCLAPTAGTAMTEGLVEEQAFKLMTPESVAPAALVLCCEDAPNRLILCAGAGGYAATHVFETQGVYLPPGQQTPDEVMALLGNINEREGEQEFIQGFMQTHKFVGMAMAALGKV